MKNNNTDKNDDHDDVPHGASSGHLPAGPHWPRSFCPKAKNKVAYRSQKKAKKGEGRESVCVSNYR